MGIEHLKKTTDNRAPVSESPQRSSRAKFWAAVIGSTGYFVSVAATAGADEAKAIAASACLACHGENGNSLVPMFPKLAGIQAEYLVKQLYEFVSGKRKNDVMTPIITALKASEITDLGAYFSTQKATAGVVQDKKAAEEGKKMFHDGNEESGVPACAGCHQPDGAGNANSPRLAGQHSEYLVQQLKNFKDGLRANDTQRVMRAVAKRMTEQEMKVVAEYIAGL